MPDIIITDPDTGATHHLTDAQAAAIKTQYKNSPDWADEFLADEASHRSKLAPEPGKTASSSGGADWHDKPMSWLEENHPNFAKILKATSGIMPGGMEMPMTGAGGAMASSLPSIMEMLQSPEAKAAGSMVPSALSGLFKGGMQGVKDELKNKTNFSIPGMAGIGALIHGLPGAEISAGAATIPPVLRTLMKAGSGSRDSVEEVLDLLKQRKATPPTAEIPPSWTGASGLKPTPMITPQKVPTNSQLPVGSTTPMPQAPPAAPPDMNNTIMQLFNKLKPQQPMGNGAVPPPGGALPGQFPQSPPSLPFNAPNAKFETDFPMMKLNDLLKGKGFGDVDPSKLPLPSKSDLVKRYGPDLFDNIPRDVKIGLLKRYGVPVTEDNIADIKKALP